MSVLLTTAYCPPIEYFAVMAKDFTLSPDRVIPSIIYIEGCENYQKQSYRNRCAIYTEGGLQFLSFPVVRDGGHKRPVRDIKVDYSTSWILQHERAIASAYGTSAFFEYYKDDFFRILESKPNWLFDLNTELTGFFMNAMGLAVDLRFTDSYTAPGETVDDMEDFRYIIHPKKQNTILEGLNLKKPYFQVFSGKHGFISNLSVMDLLFNEGPDAILYLKNV